MDGNLGVSIAAMMLIIGLLVFPEEVGKKAAQVVNSYNATIIN